MSTAEVATATATAAATAPKVTKPRVSKAKTNKAVDPKVICEHFAQQVMARYQLENEVMASMSEVVLAVLNNYHIYTEQQQQTSSVDSSNASESGKGKGKGKKASADAAAKPKTPRQSSAYNTYVKEMMQDPKVKTVPQKEKMTIIGNMWKALSDADKEPYKAKAAALKAASGDDTETATQLTSAQ
jgi:hypothetical protein